MKIKKKWIKTLRFFGEKNKNYCNANLVFHNVYHYEINTKSINYSEPDIFCCNKTMKFII